MAVIEDDTFENLDGSPDTESDADLPGKEGTDTEIDEGFEDLLSASETIEVEGMEPEEPEADAAAQAQQQVEEEDPDDDSKLSESIKKRIQRAKRVGEWEAEERVREEMAQEVTTWKQRAEEAEKRAQQAATQGSNTTSASEPAELTAMRDKLKAAKDKRRQAKVEGDVDAEESADEEVRDLDFKVRVAEATLAAQRQRQQQQGNTGAQDTGAARTDATRQQQPAAKGMTEGARTNISSWVERNATWYGKAGFEEATAKAKEIDADLWKKGYRPEDADYFTELDRRLMKSGVRRPGAPAASSNGGGSNVAPANGGADRSRGNNGNGGNPSGGNRVRLSADDVRMMRSLKLDPTNKAVVAEWVRNGRGA